MCSPFGWVVAHKAGAGSLAHSSSHSFVHACCGDEPNELILVQPRHTCRHGAWGKATTGAAARGLLGTNLDGNAACITVVEGDLGLVVTLELAGDGGSDGDDEVAHSPGVAGNGAAAGDVVLDEVGGAGAVDEGDLLKDLAGIGVVAAMSTYASE